MLNAQSDISLSGSDIETSAVSVIFYSPKAAEGNTTLLEISLQRRDASKRISLRSNITRRQANKTARLP